MTSILVQSGKLVPQCQTILGFNALRDYGGGGAGANRNIKMCNLQSDRHHKDRPNISISTLNFMQARSPSRRPPNTGRAPKANCDDMCTQYCCEKGRQLLQSAPSRGVAKFHIFDHHFYTIANHR